MDNALSLIKIGALDGLGNNCIENASLHDLIYLSMYFLIFFFSIASKRNQSSFDEPKKKFLFNFAFEIDDNQINAKSDFNGTNMSKVEPIDEDQDYHDAESRSEAAINFKDDDGSMENGNIDDTDKEAIDSKPVILGSLNSITTNVDSGDTTNANNVGTKRRDSNDDTCATGDNDTNLNETDANDSDSKLGEAFNSNRFL